MQESRVATKRSRVAFIAIALCIASIGLLMSPAPASAFTGDRSCACSNLEACPYMFQRLCCTWNSGGGYSCECSFWVTNCVEDQ